MTLTYEVYQTNWRDRLSVFGRAALDGALDVEVKCGANLPLFFDIEAQPRPVVSLPMLVDGGRVRYINVDFEKWQRTTTVIAAIRRREIRRKRFGLKLGLAGFVLVLAIFIGSFL